MSIEVQGLESVQKKLKTLDDALGSSGIRSTLMEIGTKVQSVINESFENERSPFGQKWAPLKIATIKAKAKRGISLSILRDSGNLRDNWMPYVENDSVTIANNMTQTKGYAYGKAHQFGTKHMPKRAFLPIDDNGNLEPRLLKTIDSYLGNQIAKALG